MTIVVAGDEAVAVHPGNAGRPQALGSRHIQLQSEIVLSVLGPPSAVCRRQALDIWAHTGNDEPESSLGKAVGGLSHFSATDVAPCVLGRDPRRLSSSTSASIVLRMASFCR